MAFGSLSAMSVCATEPACTAIRPPTASLPFSPRPTLNGLHFASSARGYGETMVVSRIAGCIREICARQTCSVRDAGALRSGVGAGGPERA